MPAPSTLTIMSINSNERNGINCWRDSKIIPVKTPKTMKFRQMEVFLADT